MNYQEKIFALNSRGVGTIKKPNIIKMQLDMEQHIPKATQVSHNNNQKEYDYGILQWERITIPRNRCIRCCSRSKSSMSHGWHAVLECKTLQSSPATNGIHEQEPNKSRNQLQQNREGFPRHNPWPTKIPPLLFCLWGQHDNRSQTVGSIFYEAGLSHRLQRILLRIHQYNIRILYKPGQWLFIADWLSRHNHQIERWRNTWHVYNINAIVIYRDSRQYDSRRDKMG